VALPHPGSNRRVRPFLALLACLLLAGCNKGTETAAKRVIRVGYFPNITHSQALIGLSRGDFQKALGDVEIQPTVFNAGPSVIEALFAGQIDLSYIGPNPAINGYVKSEGQALRVIAGATSGGAAFVVRPEANIRHPEDLDGKKIASPQMGNTQDVALRTYLMNHGLAPTEKGGTVQIVPTENPLILDLLRQDQIDGAWVPEPWASRLIVEGGADLFLDERTLWPDGKFVTTNIIVSTKFLQENPDIVRLWLATHVDITLWEQSHPREAMQLTNQEIERIIGKPISDEILKMAWSRMDVTYDPLCSSLFKSARDAFQAGFLSEDPDLSSIYDLQILNQVLKDLQLETIAVVKP
jgi:NitT/TauT family transport system substrate-binding protein